MDRTIVVEYFDGEKKVKKVIILKSYILKKIYCFYEQTFTIV